MLTAEKPIGCHLPDEFGCLAVVCWCERHVCYVPVADVRAGRTISCGRRDCKEPS